jgi:hypothetical protein
MMTEIFGATEWYRARPEPEREWRGVLRKQDVPMGPASRTSLSYALITNDPKHHSVYAANVEKQLAPYVGRAVILRAKLVDLSGEGYGQELWIASIRSVEAETK